MTFDVEVFLRQLRALDALRAKSGVPPVSALWWTWIDRFFRSGKRQIVIRKGRRVGASTIIAPLIAVATALYMPHPVPPESTGSNPAREIFASLKPSIATMPLARIWMCSSPLSVEDYHARCFEDGDTPFQNVELGSTWELNPQLSEADCRALESDPRVFDREYRAIPSAAVSPAFDPAHAIRSIRPLPEGCRFFPPIGTLDSAAGKSMGADRMAWGTFAIAELPAPRRFCIATFRVATIASSVVATS